MIPAAFAYDRAASVDEALGLLVTHGADAKIIAGGQSLLPLMKLRLARPDRLIDIGRVDALKGLRQLPSGGAAIGPLTTYAELLADSRVMRFELFADALPNIGDVQVRNRGTIGGSIAHADPAADMPALLLVLDAELVIRSAHRGERIIPIDGFFHGAFTTDLAPDELITEIRLPSAPRGDFGSAYRMLEQPASGFAIAGVAAVVGKTGSGDGFDFVHVAVTGVGDMPYRAKNVEDALIGTNLGSAAIGSAVASICDGVDVQGDIHADATYRAAMAGVMARRAIEAARERLG